MYRSLLNASKQQISHVKSRKIHVHLGLPVDLNTLKEISDKPITSITIGPKVMDSLKEKSVNYANMTEAYGKGRGFGVNQSTKVKLSEAAHQRNLVLSHSVGFNHKITAQESQRFYDEKTVRHMLLSRLIAMTFNTNGETFTGVSPDVVNFLKVVLEKNALPKVAKRHTLSASGDLGPNAAMARVLLGYGEMKNPQTNKYEPAEKVIQQLDLKPLTLRNNDGLVLINGVGLTTANLVDVSMKIESYLNTNMMVLALSLNAMEARKNQFNPLLAQTRLWLTTENTHNKNNYESYKNCLGYFYNALNGASENESIIQNDYSVRNVSEVFRLTWNYLNVLNKTLVKTVNSAQHNPLMVSSQQDEQMMSSNNFNSLALSHATSDVMLMLGRLNQLNRNMTEALNDPKKTGMLHNFTARNAQESGAMVWGDIAQMAVSLTAAQQLSTFHGMDMYVSSSLGQENMVSTAWHKANQLMMALENLEECQVIQLALAVILIQQKKALQPDLFNVSPVNQSLIQRVMECLEKKGVTHIGVDALPEQTEQLLESCNEVILQDKYNRFEL